MRENRVEEFPDEIEVLEEEEERSDIEGALWRCASERFNSFQEINQNFTQGSSILAGRKRNVLLGGKFGDIHTHNLKCGIHKMVSRLDGLDGVIDNVLQRAQEANNHRCILICVFYKCANELIVFDPLLSGLIQLSECEVFLYGRKLLQIVIPSFTKLCAEAKAKKKRKNGYTEFVLNVWIFRSEIFEEVIEEVNVSLK